MNMRLFVPLILFGVIVVVLWRGLGLHANEIPSPLLNEPAPQFQLRSLFDPNKTFSNKDLMGQVSLVNFWASWCYACGMEHPFLVKVAKDSHIIFYGINYKDDTGDARRWLKIHGNPYQLIGVDETGDTGINWGIYGTPETFIIDKHGIIRYTQIGVINAEIWQQYLLPIIQHLQKE